MDESRQHFLAGAGFPDDQHRAVGGRDAAREIQDQSRRVVDRNRLQGFAQIHVGAHLETSTRSAEGGQRLQLQELCPVSRDGLHTKSAF